MKASIIKEEVFWRPRTLADVSVGDLVEVTDSNYHGEILIIVQPYKGHIQAISLSEGKGRSNWDLTSNPHCPLEVRILQPGTRVQLTVDE